jgi:transposase InsO family protein
MENLQRMRRLDAHYTQTPYDGTRRMTAWLRSQGYAVNRKRVTRLLRTMGVETISPKPHLSQPHPAHRVYPYLLRGVPITRVNQVWSTDTESTEHTRQTTSTHKPFFGVVLHSSDESEGTLRYEVGSFRQAAALVPPPPSTRPCASVLRDRPDIH